MADAKPGDESISAALRKVLNAHGYGFQYSILQACLNRRMWLDPIAEFPVELHGASVHIDFILGYDSHLLVAECKKVDGWTWAFARGHRNVAGRWAQYPRVDVLRWNPASNNFLERDARALIPWEGTYDVAVAFKSHRQKANEPENGANVQKDTTTKALDQAVTQVFRATGGLMQRLEGEWMQTRYQGGAIVPVIFTNALLVVTDMELFQANVDTGRVPEIDAHPTDYVWFNYNLSPDLQPRIRRARQPASDLRDMKILRNIQDHDTLKSVAIVSPAGIVRFLENLTGFVNARPNPID
jgi:hypothetical protein